MTTHAHARPGLLSRFRRQPPQPDARVFTDSKGNSWNVVPAPPRRAPEVAPEAPHGIATDETLTRLIGQARDEQARTGAGAEPTEPWDKPDDLMPDHRDTWSALARNYVEPPDATRPDPLHEKAPACVPDLHADIRELPFFRAAIRLHARRLHAGCACEPGDAAWVGWLAGQYADLRPPETSWRAAAQATPEQADEMEAAA